MKQVRKRILMLLENSSFPEDSRVFLEAKSLVSEGYSVTVICPTGASKSLTDDVDGIRVLRYPAPWEFSGFFGYVWEYAYSLTMMAVYSVYALLFIGFDAVHVHTPPDMTAIIAIFYQAFGKKFVFDLHDLSPELYMARSGREQPNLVYRVLRQFERLACRHADRLIATNTTQRDVQVDRCGADPDRCYIVRNGPNMSFLEKVEPADRYDEVRHEQKLIFGYVGIIGIQDGVDYLVRLVHLLKTKHGREDLHAVIVGDGPALGQLKELAKTLDVEDLFTFAGLIPFSSVPSTIAAFDICFTPDPSNAYNDSCTTIKTMEYMALSKPTVCFRTKENVQTAQEAALYAENNNLDDFCQQTLRLMDSMELRRSMGEVGRKRIDDGLTWGHQSMQLLKLYGDLFSETRKVEVSTEDRALHEEHEAEHQGEPAAAQQSAAE